MKLFQDRYDFYNLSAATKFRVIGDKVCGLFVQEDRDGIGMVWRDIPDPYAAEIRELMASAPGTPPTPSDPNNPPAWGFSGGIEKGR